MTGVAERRMRWRMTPRSPLVLLTLLLAACAASDSEIADQGNGRCLYAVERSLSRDTKWAPCTAPPPCAVERLTGDDRSRIGAGC